MREGGGREGERKEGRKEGRKGEKEGLALLMIDPETPKMGAEGTLSKISTRLPHALDAELTLFYSSSQTVLGCAVLPSFSDKIMYGSATAK